MGLEDNSSEKEVASSKKKFVMAGKENSEKSGEETPIVDKDGLVVPKYHGHHHSHKKVDLVPKEHDLPSFTEHTEDLIKAESERIITLLLSHIDELQTNLNSKLKDLEELSQNTKIVHENINQPEQDEEEETTVDNTDVDPRKIRINYDISKKINDDYVNQLSKVVNKLVSKNIKEMEEKLTKQISRKLITEMKVVFAKDKLLLYGTDVKEKKSKKKSKRQTIKTKFKPKAKLEIDPNLYFRLEDGSILKSIDELYDEILVMKESIYNAHVTSDRNDFANWVKHVFNEDNLAEKLTKSKKKFNAEKILKEYLAKSS